jgi:hypothetical protein
MQTLPQSFNPEAQGAQLAGESWQHLAVLSMQALPHNF